MTNNVRHIEVGFWFKMLLGLDLVVMFFSGFGQMPIYARYYITSLPGLGWSGDFQLNSAIHYGAAAVFLALVAYFLVLKFSNGKLGKISGILRPLGVVVVAGLIVSGSLLVFRDLGWTVLPSRLIVGALVTHLATAMVLLALLVVHFSLDRGRTQRQP